MPASQPVLLLYGLFFAASGALLIALSLGELASAFPTSRGPMEWTYNFTPPSWRRPLVSQGHRAGLHSSKLTLCT